MNLPAAAPHRPRGTPRKSRRSRWRLAALVGVHLLVLVHVAQWKLGGTTLTPVEPSEAGETLTLGYVNAGFLLFAVLILATLVLGRFFCGWACHVVAYQDACAWLLGKLGIRPRPVRSRLLMLVPLFAALEMFVLPSVLRWARGGDLLPESLSWHLVTDDLWARFPGPWMTAATLLVDGFLVVWLLGAKGFCTYGCPYGAIFGLVDRRARGRIRVTDACEGCGHCTATCTSNVQVHAEVARHGMVVDPGCMKCMDCVSVCPKDALYYGTGPSRAAALAGSKGRTKTTWDFTWPEELTLAAVFLGALYAWRNLYAAVPFLLALGLSVITALAVVLLARLFRQSEVRLQHLLLRREGRFTGAGVTGVAGLGLLLAFVAHSAVVQYHQRQGEGLLAELHGELPSVGVPADPARARVAERAERALEHLRSAQRLALVDTAGLRASVAALASGLGRLDEAEAALAAWIALEPDAAPAHLRLADVRLAAGDEAGALEALRAHLALAPGSLEAGPRLVRLMESGRVGVEAHLLLADLLVEHGQREGARRALEEALERAPEDGRVSDRLGEL